MGIGTAIYSIDYSLYKSLREKRHLKRLIDVLNGYKKVDPTGLPKDYRFRWIDLNKSWYDIYDLFRGKEPIKRYEDEYFPRLCTSDSEKPITFQGVDVAFWSPDHEIKTLDEFNFFINAIIWEIRLDNRIEFLEMRLSTIDIAKIRHDQIGLQKAAIIPLSWYNKKQIFSFGRIDKCFEMLGVYTKIELDDNEDKRKFQSERKGKKEISDIKYLGLP